MKSNRLPALACLGVVALSACTGPEPGSPAWVAELEQKRQETRADTARDDAARLPDWYLTPPTDQHAAYAPGTGVSGDLQLAIDKAVLTAKRQLADRINGKLSSKTKEFVAESGAEGDAILQAETERATINLITEANLAGYEVTRKEVISMGALFRAYVLLRYPLGGANRLLMDRVKHDDAVAGRLRASKAFLELEQDIREAGNAGGEPPPPVAAAGRPKVDISP